MITPAQVIFDVNSQVFYCICICQIFTHNSEISPFPSKCYLSTFVQWQRPILFGLTQVEKLSRSSWMVQWSIPIAKIYKSSAKMNGSEIFSASGKSLMKMQNKSGPSSEPLGTPLLTSWTSEHVLSILTNCFRLLSQSMRTCRRHPPTPIFTTFLIARGTLSKAFEKFV